MDLSINLKATFAFDFGGCPCNYYCVDGEVLFINMTRGSFAGGIPGCTTGSAMALVCNGDGTWNLTGGSDWSLGDPDCSIQISADINLGIHNGLPAGEVTIPVTYGIQGGASGIPCGTVTIRFEQA